MFIEKMAIEIYHPFIPLSKRSEGMILGKYKEARDKYLPLIEERTGIDLGTVGVTSLREGMRGSFKTSFREAWNESGMLEKTALVTLSSVVYPVMELFRMFHEDFYLATYAGHRKCIGVAFGFCAKVNYLHRNLTRGFDQKIDEIVIHELTHHLWNTINNKSSDAPKLFTEGYAMYGEHNWFADLLPIGKHLENPDRHFNRNYREGRKAIEGLVKKHGEDVLLEIPKRWLEFKKELAA